MADQTPFCARLLHFLPNDQIVRAGEASILPPRNRSKCVINAVRGVEDSHKIDDLLCRNPHNAIGVSNLMDATSCHHNLL